MGKNGNGDGSGMKVAVVTGIFGLVTVIITVVGGPLFFRWLDGSDSSSSSTGIVSSQSVTEEVSDTEPTSDTGNDWRPLSFVTPNSQYWRESGDNRYVALEQHDSDAIAWSTESFAGDVSVSLELKSAVESGELSRSELEQQIPNQNSGCVVLYGNGQGYSDEGLIFCVDWDGYYMWKHSRHTEENLMAFVPQYLQSDKVYKVVVEINDDLATMDVNGERVLSTFFDTEEIDRSGRVALLRYGESGEISFSNIQVKS